MSPDRIERVHAFEPDLRPGRQSPWPREAEQLSLRQRSLSAPAPVHTSATAGGVLPCDNVARRRYLPLADGGCCLREPACARLSIREHAVRRNKRLWLRSRVGGRRDERTADDGQERRVVGVPS